MIRILVVDDHVVVRSGLMALLDGKNGIKVVGDAADGDEAIRKAVELQPNVVLMDFSMPPGKDGLTATTELKKQLPDTEVLILTMHDDEEYLFRAIQAGASGYILKAHLTRSYSLPSSLWPKVVPICTRMQPND